MVREAVDRWTARGLDPEALRAVLNELYGLSLSEEREESGAATGAGSVSRIVSKGQSAVRKWCAPFLSSSRGDDVAPVRLTLIPLHPTLRRERAARAARSEWLTCRSCFVAPCIGSRGKHP
jgi:hypothetical protein